MKHVIIHAFFAVLLIGCAAQEQFDNDSHITYTKNGKTSGEQFVESNISQKSKRYRGEKLQVGDLNPNTNSLAQVLPTKATNEATSDSLVQQAIQLTNQYRAEHGLQPLQNDLQVINVAQQKAEDMQANGYFSHTSPTFGTPFEMLQAFDVSFRSGGENIAKGQRTAEQVVNDWMNSPSHRANILNETFTNIGIGHTPEEDYWVQLFIKK
ncbi:transporter [Bacillus sp. HMF5848]|uniref:CAP domain-containing protein n=1 Tax=Bacillus sp. HMF5848 TaxID=2495421 RepID=UPI000F799380|nr:CAP domain-containing protein [Bacillus sp. HMF5848]RSK27224.1 transporter [Bacillus sp. HMF5848]